MWDCHHNYRIDGLTIATEMRVCHCSCRDEGLLLSLQLQKWGSHHSCRIEGLATAAGMRDCHCSCRDEGLSLQVQRWGSVSAAAEMKDSHCGCRDEGLSLQLQRWETVTAAAGIEMRWIVSQSCPWSKQRQLMVFLEKRQTLWLWLVDYF